jgi:hypothetical protein
MATRKLQTRRGGVSREIGCQKSHSEQVGTELDVSALLGPEVERDGSDFVDQRVGEAVLAQVDGLDVSVANVAALDTNVGKLGRGIDGKLGMIFLVAAGTDDTAELPLAEAEATEQIAAGSIAERAKHAECRVAAAERAQRVSVAFELERNPGANELGIGL